MDEQSSAGDKCMGEPLQGARCHLRVTAIQRADPHRESEVVRCLVGREHEVFAGNGAHAENASTDEILGRVGELPNGFLGSIDGEDMPAWGDSARYLSCRRSRPASDLDDAHSGPKRKGINDCLETWGQLRHVNHRRSRHTSTQTDRPPLPIPKRRLGQPEVAVESSSDCGQDGPMARLSQLVVDSREPSSLAHFWAAALDDFTIRAYDDAEIVRLASVGRTPETDPCVILDGPFLEICFQEIGELATQKRPMHIDIETTKRNGERSRLVSLGASVVEEFESHTWMRDPEGNDFCLTDS